ncbi:MAG: ABC transporter ATP-binding protein [Fimbriimonas ginsengisoli]|uniref:ABC transporter ATP-binding protein n=1 Tax=Fimbriimonas ginsengisoli TaxID=1005039 RepID=A0A931LT66_FIMGI|nr:ABC transporter ATP-binding protein [Fimbriimonas ginsengisoli]
MSAAIETKALTKTYKSRALGKINVVDNLDLQVEEGEIFGFLGPNGAGKTTTIKMLLGIINPTSGEGFVLGREIGDMDVHRVISYLPERPYYYEHMTGLELLMFYDSLFGNKDQAKCQRLLEKVNLATDASKTIVQFSKGMQQRIGLAQSLLNDPKLLFLDEPTAGLDPIAHTEIRDLILNFRHEGRTVFISSHELSEVERICDRVAIIHRGKVMRQGHLNDLLRGGRIEIIAEGLTREFSDKVKLKDATVSFADGRLIVDMPEDSDPNSLVDGVRVAKGKIVSVIPRRKRLEDLFVETVKDIPIGAGEKN